VNTASYELESFVDETIRLGRAKGYDPKVFIGMRQHIGTRSAISRLVTNGDVQSSFNRLDKLGLLDWTIEAAVGKFPTEFSKSDRECAAFRLQQARAKE
jgi:hypothetical protein